MKGKEKLNKKVKDSPVGLKKNRADCSEK